MCFEWLGLAPRERICTGRTAGEASPSFSLAPGWTEDDPVETEYAVLFEHEGIVSLSTTSFQQKRVLGRIGGAACPFAVDEEKGIAFRAIVGNSEHCTEPLISEAALKAIERKLPRSLRSLWRESADTMPEALRESERAAKTLRGSGIYAIDLATGATRLVVGAPDRCHFYWLLALLAKREQLVSFMSSDADGEVAGHELALIGLDSGDMARRPLPDTVFHPEGICFEREQVVFGGTTGGTYLVGLDGHVLRSAKVPRRRPTMGASFNPRTGHIAVGGHGIYTWDPSNGSTQKVHRKGQYPTWSVDGQHIWFNKSDSDVWRLDVSTGRAERIVALTGGMKPSRGYGHPIIQTADGRYLLARLTGKRRIPPSSFPEIQVGGLEDGAIEVSLDYHDYFHCFCTIDTQEQRVWHAPGYLNDVAWVSSRYAST